MVKLTYNGLPVGDHGIHFHSIGKCEGPDFASAGCTSTRRIRVSRLKRPPGRTPGIYARPDRPGFQDGVPPGATNFGAHRQPGPTKPIGQFRPVGAKPDDQTTDPSGNSGDRIACGLAANTPTVVAGTPGATTTPGTPGPTPTAGPTTTPGATATAGTPGGTTTPGTRGPTTPGGTPATTSPGGTPGPSPTR